MNARAVALGVTVVVVGIVGLVATEPGMIRANLISIQRSSAWALITIGLVLGAIAAATLGRSTRNGMGIAAIITVAPFILGSMFPGIPGIHGAVEWVQGLAGAGLEHLPAEARR